VLVLLYSGGFCKLWWVAVPHAKRGGKSDAPPFGTDENETAYEYAAPFLIVRLLAQGYRPIQPVLIVPH
jgi:hypothetical protein